MSINKLNPKIIFENLLAKIKQNNSHPRNTLTKQNVPVVKENIYLVWGMFIVFLLCVFSVTSHKIEDDDFFWHLSTGKFITENGYVPSTDVFGYATQNAEWIPFEWGSDVVFYTLYKVVNYNGIFIFGSIIFCLIFLIYFRLLSKLRGKTCNKYSTFFFLLIAFF